MKTFLEQPEATFYHITKLENWDKIDHLGIIGRNGKIFVSRTGEMPVLASIAVDQLPEIQNASGIAIIKIPQALNKFTQEEIFEDNQAPNELTGKLQNIILRDLILPGHFELMMKISFNGDAFNVLANLALQANKYVTHEIYKRGLNLTMNKFPDILL